MKKVACSRLGTMLHLGIQKGKEAMETLEFQKYLGGTAVCMKILSVDTKGWVQLTSNETYFADSWFSSVKTAEDEMAAGVNYFGSVKMSHRGFCLATLENLINDCPGGSYIVIKNTPRVSYGRTLPNIGYKYNYRMVLGFIAT